MKCEGISERTWAVTSSLLKGLTAGITTKKAMVAASAAPPMPLNAPVQNERPRQIRDCGAGRSFIRAEALRVCGAAGLPCDSSWSSACRICMRSACGAAAYVTPSRNAVRALRVVIVGYHGVTVGCIVLSGSRTKPRRSCCSPPSMAISHDCQQPAFASEPRRASKPRRRAKQHPAPRRRPPGAARPSGEPVRGVEMRRNLPLEAARLSSIELRLIGTAFSPRTPRREYIRLIAYTWLTTRYFLVQSVCFPPFLSWPCSRRLVPRRLSTPLPLGCRGRPCAMMQRHHPCENLRALTRLHRVPARLNSIRRAHS